MGTDSLYYIMDYSSHYYRTDKSDQLVVVAGEQKENNDDEYISPMKELTYDEVTELIEKNVASYDRSEMDWVEYLTHFTYLVEGLKDYREELSKSIQI